MTSDTEGGFVVSSVRSARTSPLAERRELAGLLACLPGDTTALADAWARVADPARLLEVAERHAVDRVLLDGLARAGVELPTTWVPVRSERLTRARLRLAWFDHGLREAVEVLDRAEISVVTVKGPSLARRLYDDPSLRPFADLDLVVEPSDRVRAVEALSVLGYRPPADDPAAAELGILVAEGRPPMELHDAAVPPVFGAGWSARAVLDRRIRIDGLPVPSPDDELIGLAVHAAVHSYERLLWLHDLRLVAAARPELASADGSARLLERARTADLDGVVGETLAAVVPWMLGGEPLVRTTSRLEASHLRRLDRAASWVETGGGLRRTAGRLVTRAVLDGRGTRSWALYGLRALRRLPARGRRGLSPLLDT